jgi:phosphate transport system ATP-binding protein
METVNTAAMQIADLTVSYDDKPAVQGLTLDIPTNRITAIIGPSGCGKSTLLHCMNGLIRKLPNAKTQGIISLNGQNIDRLPADELHRRVGLVFQTPSSFPLSIYKNMIYAPKYYGIRDKQKLNAIVTEKLKLAGLYDEVKDELNKNALKLSGGQQQRLCIARALTVEPEILLLDEPCSALDVKSSAVIEETLIELKRRYTIVIVTHNIQQARRISDYAAFMYGGRLIGIRALGRAVRAAAGRRDQSFP